MASAILMVGAIRTRIGRICVVIECIGGGECCTRFDWLGLRMSGSYIVIDTNIWVYNTQLLTIPIGAALLYAARRIDAKIGLPEVIEREIIKNTLVRFRGAAQAVHEGYRLIEAFMGERDNYSVPSEHEVEKRVMERLSELAGFIHRTPFTFNHAKNALSRVMEDAPPNGPKNQQFKDSAIWEALLELSCERHVHFITQDGGFFKDNKKKEELAENLLAEAGGRIQIYSDLSQFLNQIGEDIPALDRSEITEKIDRSIHDRMSQHAATGGYKLDGLKKEEVSFYLTEKHDVLAVDFKFYYRIEGLTDSSVGHREIATLVVEANTSYLLESEAVGPTLFERISAIDENGENVRGVGAIFISAGMGVIGRHNVPYTFRERIHED